MFINFAIENWYLFVMLAAILLLLAFDPAGRTVGGAAKIDPAQLPQLQNRKSAVVVDIRNADEFENGHIEQALNLPLDSIETNLKKLNKHKGKPLILVCQSGARTAKAVGILKKNAFEELYVLDGGIASWSKDNLPLSKGKK
jgi:rhodanese-related sulfurtransferase